MRNFKQHKQLSSSFTIVPNSIFMDKDMSLKALGTLCRLLSLPENWEFSEMGLVAITKDSRTAVRSALKELEEKGYLARERVRDEKGKLRGTIWHVYEEPYFPAKEEGNYNPTVAVDGYYDWMSDL